MKRSFWLYRPYIGIKGDNNSRHVQIDPFKGLQEQSGGRGKTCRASEKL